MRKKEPTLNEYHALSKKGEHYIYADRYKATKSMLWYLGLSPAYKKVEFYRGRKIVLTIKDVNSIEKTWTC